MRLQPKGNSFYRVTKYAILYVCRLSTPPYLTTQQKLFQMNQTNIKNLIRNLLTFHPKQQMSIQETKRHHIIVVSTTILEDLHFIDTFLPHIKTKHAYFSDYIDSNSRSWYGKYLKHFQATFKWRRFLLQYWKNIQMKHYFSKFLFWKKILIYAA